ncbi:hypothetical protein PYCCODRAFT_1359511 [Trametes coccinea BRFM310]|uniref:Zn(2)-C6 fungal-type domain-containing protein n=1 Tax=Trametes coccinea (strain BRFM310) TaxID=1353009 RepID=A0A1Y2J044_TRAC3|nr:hypothetical protein PYCCODRAFT_1359511 [Trametes coccinea BRFM310]
MSSESPAAKKRAAATSPKRTPEDDHRRKRRNRPTQSCLNCHTSKRMCDRQRPCGRCTQLGLTGLCVYEVDNPSQRANAHDEAARLQKRVAELESIIRELKNKPHPRWAQHGGPNGADANSTTTSTGTTESSGTSASHSTSKIVQSTPRFSTSPNPASRSRAFTPSSPSPAPGTSSGPSSLSSPYGSPSPLATPGSELPSPTDPYASGSSDLISSMLNSDYDLSSLLSSCQTGSNGPGADAYLNDMLETLLTPAQACPAGHSQDHCGCLNDHTSYTTVLELSLRLRRATEVLAQYANHGAQSDCKVHRRISELDRFTTTALGNIASPPEPLSHPPTPPVSRNAMYGLPGQPGLHASHSGSAQPQAQHALQSPRAWDFKQAQPQSYPSPPWDDSFMSWEPLRQPPEWPQGL